MMIVVYGGTTADIAQAIYDLVGVNIQTYGTTAYTITTEDSDTLVISLGLLRNRQIGLINLYQV